MFSPRVTSCLLSTSFLVSAIFATPEGCDAQLLPRRPATGSGRVQLNYVQAKWRRVLADLASSMNVTLVMPEEPSGYFSRLDRSPHTPAEAIRILNQELRAHGFRLLAKGGYLLVLELDATRPEYNRPSIPSRAQQATRRAPTAMANSRTAAPRNATMRRLPPTHSPTTRHGLRPKSPVRQVGFVSPTASVEGREVVSRVTIKQQRADLVAGRIFDACQGRTTATSSHDQPLAFRVNLGGREARAAAQSADGLDSAAATAHFTITTDQQANELVLRTSPALARAATHLVKSFDSPNVRPGVSERLIAGIDDAVSIGRAVQEPLNALRRRQQVRRVAARRPQEQSEPMPPIARPGGRALDVLQTIEQLSGDVTVEAIEDLGALILRGDQNDVDAVAKLVLEIQRLGIGAGPEIHLLMLSFVNSESLAQLMGDVFAQVKANPRAGGVSIFPVRLPNAILIVTSAAQMPAVLELADKLDQPGDPDSVFRVFALRQAVAAEVLQLLEDFYEAKGGLAPRIKAVVDVRTNSLIVQGAPRDLAEVGALIERIDHDESQAVSQMRIFALKNAAAEDLVEVINTALRSALTDPLNLGRAQPGATGSPPNAGGDPGAGGAGLNRRAQSAKSVVLQFLAADGVNRDSIRSGILSDIRVSADPRTNSLVVTAPEQSMTLMAELIRQLDTPTSMVAEIKVFTLANADATAMARLLETLFASPVQQQRLGVQFAGAEDASSSLIPMKFSVDVRTNSILATGGAEALRVMEAILLRLDQSDLRQRKSVVYKLRNSPARDVAEAINQFLQSQRDLSQVDPNLVSTVEQVEREVIVVPELVSNSLLISSTPRYYDEILDLTQQLDQPPPQVIIQALLVEVVLDSDDEFGVELGVQDSVLFDRSAISDIVTVTDTVFDAVTGLPVASTERIVSQAAQPGFSFNNQPLGNNPAVNTSSVGGQGLSSFGLGRMNSDLGYGGLVLSAGSESVSVLVRALAARRKINVLSRPQIRTLDNQPATIQVGQQVPIVDGVSITSTGAANPVVRQEQSGIILSVTPRISPEEVIVMEVSAEKSQFQPGGQVLFSDGSNVVSSPIKDIINARTTVSIPNGQTVVLGGMITTLDDVTERKVPWLGDLPIVGHAFRHDIERTRRTELLIFLTPRVIHGSHDSEMIKQVEAARLHYVEHAAEEVHGPLFGVPEEPAFYAPEAPSVQPGTPPQTLELTPPTPVTPELADPTQP